MQIPPIDAAYRSPTRRGTSRRESRSRRRGFDQAKLRVRSFKSNDLGALVKIDSLCFPAALAYNKEHMLGYLRHRSVTAFIAEYDRKIIGFALEIHRKKEKCIHLVTLDVIPQYQGLGVGKCLLGVVLQTAVSLRVGRIQLEVAVTNKRAIDLYQTFGFRIWRRLKKYYADNTDGLFMVLSFGAHCSQLKCAPNDNWPIICGVSDSEGRVRSRDSSCT